MGQVVIVQWAGLLFNGEAVRLMKRACHKK
jgi:hypothetical protein